MDKLYNKNDVTPEKFAPLNNYTVTTLCKTYKLMCKTHKMQYCLYVKKTVDKLGRFIPLSFVCNLYFICCTGQKTPQQSDGIALYRQRS